MRLFANEVAPSLRRDSADLFARNFPALGDIAMAGAARMIRALESAGMHRCGGGRSGERLVYLHGFADIHGSSSDWLPFHRALAAHFASRPRIPAATPVKRTRRSTPSRTSYSTICKCSMRWDRRISPRWSLDWRMDRGRDRDPDSGARALACADRRHGPLCASTSNCRHFHDGAGQ